MNRARLAAPIALGAILLVGQDAYPQNAATPETLAPKLEEIERSIEATSSARERLSREAASIERELAQLRQRSIAIAAAIQANEAREADVLARVKALAELEAGQSAALEQRRIELVALIMALQRIARQPPESLLLAPESPIDTARRAKLLGHAVPRIEAMAADLSREVSRLAATRAGLAAERIALADNQEKLAADRRALATLIERKGRLHAETAAEQRVAQQRLDRLARQSSDVRELIEKLVAERARREAEERRQREEAARLAAERQAAERQAAERQAAERRSALERAAEEAARRERESSAKRQASLPPPAPSPALGAPGRLAEPQGQMVQPVRGKVVLGYGQPGDGGQSQRGVTFETRPGAQVVAPYGGQIAFAGPFRAYGLILIIEHSEGYHSLLAGLGRIDTVVGQWVAAGEPVGAAEESGASNPRFYVELRRNGQPIDPLPWLATLKEKVSG